MYRCNSQGKIELSKTMAAKTWKDNQSENESLQARIREMEDENQELRAQNLIQNRTILELRNEMILMRIQLNEMADTSVLLRERVRMLSQNMPQESDGNIGQITVPPLMAPPPVPPPLPPSGPPSLPPSRIRISPRQVGAGEALTTPLGVSLSSPPRHRIKRDCRQGFYRSSRPVYRRFDNSEPGPSSSNPFLSPIRPNYFVGLRIIPQFQTSFVCSQNSPTGFSDSNSDSSGSDESTQQFKKPKTKPLISTESGGFKRPKEFDFLRSGRNLHHQKVRQTILQNYNLSTPNTNSKFFIPVPYERKNRENVAVPSTSGNIFDQTENSSSNEQIPNGSTFVSKISDCVQYTFPTIHEGLHQNGSQSVVTNTGQPLRLRKLKKNIPYSRPENINKSEEAKKDAEDIVAKFLNEKKWEKPESSNNNNAGTDSESLVSINEPERSQEGSNMILGEAYSDLEQDGFQADESSNCLTSTDDSLEKICVSKSNIKREESS